MKKMIQHYEVKVEREFRIALPAGYEILALDLRGDEILVIEALIPVVPAEPDSFQYFWLRGMREAIPHGVVSRSKYIGRVKIALPACDKEVFYLFNVSQSREARFSMGAIQ